MNTFDILEDLQQAVTQAVVGKLNPTTQVKYVGATFKPTADLTWLELVQLPSEPVGFWGGARREIGALRLILHTPNDGSGVYEHGQLLKSICGHFTEGAVFGNTRIVGPVQIAGLLEDGNENLYPATIRYERFST